MILKHENRKITTAQDCYTPGCLLDYSYFKENYKTIVIDLSKQQALILILEQISKIIFLEI